MDGAAALCALLVLCLLLAGCTVPEWQSPERRAPRLNAAWAARP